MASPYRVTCGRTESTSRCPAGLMVLKNVEVQDLRSENERRFRSTRPSRSHCRASPLDAQEGTHVALNAAYEWCRLAQNCAFSTAEPFYGVKSCEVATSEM